MDKIVRKMSNWLISLRALIQRYLEVPLLIKIGGKIEGGHMVEVGCGSGHGLKLIREQFNPYMLHGFEENEYKLKKASSYLAKEIMNHQVFLHEESDDLSILKKNICSSIFFFRSLYLSKKWKELVKVSISRLDDGGRIYLGEYYKPEIENKWIRKILRVPDKSSFTREELINEFKINGCDIIGEKHIMNMAGVLVAVKNKPIVVQMSSNIN